MAWLPLLSRGINIYENEGESGYNQKLVRKDKKFRVVQRHITPFKLQEGYPLPIKS